MVDCGNMPQLPATCDLDKEFRFFIVIERLGLSVDAVFDKNLCFMKQCDVLKLGIELIKKV